MFCREFQGAVLLLCDDKDLAKEGMIGVVEDARGIESFAFDSHFEMKMVGSSASRTPFYADRLTCLQPLSDLNKISGMMTVKSLQTICMSHDDTISITVVHTRKDNLSRESGTGSVSCKRLDVGATMMSVSAKGTDNFTFWERIAPFFHSIVGKVDGELVTMSEGVFGSLDLHHLPLVDVNSIILSVCN